LDEQMNVAVREPHSKIEQFPHSPVPGRSSEKSNVHRGKPRDAKLDAENVAANLEVDAGQSLCHQRYRRLEAELPLQLAANSSIAPDYGVTAIDRGLVPTD
jgi:hypothetical protein